jgi:hypothetical protein
LALIHDAFAQAPSVSQPSVAQVINKYVHQARSYTGDGTLIPVDELRSITLCERSVCFVYN